MHFHGKRVVTAVTIIVSYRWIWSEHRPSIRLFQSSDWNPIKITALVNRRDLVDDVRFNGDFANADTRSSSFSDGAWLFFLMVGTLDFGFMLCHHRHSKRGARRGWWRHREIR